MAKVRYVGLNVQAEAITVGVAEPGERGLAGGSRIAWSRCGGW